MTTKVILIAVLGVTLVSVADVLRRDELDARDAAAFLLLFTALFVMRVVGQIVVLLRAPGWLPPMDEWNLLPYRLLLPIQLAFIAVMVGVATTLLAEEGPLAEPDVSFGRFLIGVSLVYAAAMAVRYAVRMARRPHERWFGGAIPIVFHLVLAAYLLTLGRFHVTG